ncbi:MAG: lysylphosphatidylglycerol synthase domain-containing protein, partial [Steroidobacteraceae bacterium]
MSRPTFWLLVGGAALFTGVLVTHGLGAVLAMLATARWSLLLVALYHLLPLAIDALALWVLLEAAASAPWRDVLVARWAGESANSLMPLGQVAGPVVMVRDLAPRRFTLRAAAAAVTVSTTLQGLAQIVFALLGVALLVLRADRGPAGHSPDAVGSTLLVAGAVLVLPVAAFYLAQRRGLFSRSMRALA